MTSPKLKSKSNLLTAPAAATFNSLSKIGKRKAIAADVIAQLTAKKYQANTGSFVCVDGDMSEIQDENNVVSGTVKEVLQKMAPKTCSVCALGGVLMSQFRLNGDCKMKDINADVHSTFLSLNPTTESERESLEFHGFALKYFGRDQLQLMEMAFERGVGACHVQNLVDDWKSFMEDANHKEQDAEIAESYLESAQGAAEEYQSERFPYTIQHAIRAIEFGERFKKDKARLIAIMNAVIESPKGEFNP